MTGSGGNSHAGAGLGSGLNSHANSELDAKRDLAASLAGGLSADRDRAVAHSTRRVVLASLGVLNDQKKGEKRSRSVAMAAVLVVLLVVGPLAWWAVENFVAGEHIGNNLADEFSLWVCILCPALLAAAFVAGWLRKRQ
jgi:hypothetical protein